MLVRKDFAKAALLVVACALLACALPVGAQVPQAAQQHRALLVRTAHAAPGTRLVAPAEGTRAEVVVQPGLRFLPAAAEVRA